MKRTNLPPPPQKTSEIDTNYVGRDKKEDVSWIVNFRVRVLLKKSLLERRTNRLLPIAVVQLIYLCLSILNGPVEVGQHL